MWWRVLPTLLWLRRRGLRHRRAHRPVLRPRATAVVGILSQLATRAKALAERAAHAPIALRRDWRSCPIGRTTAAGFGQFEQTPRVAAESAHHRMDVRMSDRVREYVSPCIRSRGLGDEGRRGDAVSAGARTSAGRGELGVGTTAAALVAGPASCRVCRKREQPVSSSGVIEAGWPRSRARRLASRCSSALTGVATACSRPSRTTSPLR